jgi:sarcosine oxidase
MQRADVVVVGAGAMGATTAWELARRGHDVVVLERFGPGHDRGSSHGATRIFRTAYRDLRYVHLALEALPLWRELEADTGEVLLEQVGALDHGWVGALDEIEANLRRAGRPVGRLDARAAGERFPGMRFDGDVVVSADGGRCWADRTVGAAWRAAVGHGAEARAGTTVEHIEVTSDGVRVHAAGGSWGARTAVVAAGAWTRSLLADLVELPPLRVEDEQPAHFRPATGAPSLDAWPSFLHHREPEGADRPLSFGAYGLPTPGEGMKVGGHGTTVPIDPDCRPTSPDPARIAALVSYVADWLPGLEPEPVTTTNCLFTTTPDEHFVLDRRGPLVVVSPCSGHGFKFVPAIAARAAALAEGGTQGEPAWRLPR